MDKTIEEMDREEIDRYRAECARQYEENGKRIQKAKIALDEHEAKMAKITDEIHRLIADANLTVCDAKKVLDDVSKRIERYSQVTPIVWDFEDTRNLLKSGHVTPQFLEAY